MKRKILKYGAKKAARSGTEMVIKNTSKAMINSSVGLRATSFLYQYTLEFTDWLLSLPYGRQLLEYLSRNTSSNIVRASVLRRFVAHSLRVGTIITIAIFIITSIPATYKFAKGELSQKEYAIHVIKNLLLILLGIIGTSFGKAFSSHFEIPYCEFIGGCIGCLLFTSMGGLFIWLTEILVNRIIVQKY